MRIRDECLADQATSSRGKLCLGQKVLPSWYSQPLLCARQMNGPTFSPAKPIKDLLQSFKSHVIKYLFPSFRITIHLLSSGNSGNGNGHLSNCQP